MAVQLNTDFLASLPLIGSKLKSIASLPERDRREVLRRFRAKYGATAVEDIDQWAITARVNQQPPPEPWTTWVLLAGRGFGKTRAGAEWVRDRVKSGAMRHGVLVAQTPADARDIMVHGPSGLLNVGPPAERPVYEPSKRLLSWPNGAIAHVRSGHDPEALRGINADTAWCDELAAWQYPREAWDNLRLGLRLGDPKAVVTTTPKPLLVLKEILKARGTVVTRGSTYENRGHLAEAFFQDIVARYEGTTLGQQELHAVLLEQAEGALWTRELLSRTRVTDAEMPATKRTVVAVDPAISKKQESNETGIVVCSRGVDDHGYVRADRSGRFSPDGWARRAVTVYHEFKADCIVAEANQGGDMVEHTIRTVEPNIRVKLVHASDGKRTRAEPVVSLYEQGRAHHVGMFEELEDQQCTWEPLGDMPSPDRLDAEVWGMTELFPVRAVVHASPGGASQKNPWAMA